MTVIIDTILRTLSVPILSDKAPETRRLKALEAANIEIIPAAKTMGFISIKILASQAR